jgi:hypothetical protein
MWRAEPVMMIESPLPVVLEPLTEGDVLRPGGTLGISDGATSRAEGALRIHAGVVRPGGAPSGVCDFLEAAGGEAGVGTFERTLAALGTCDHVAEAAAELLVLCELVVDLGPFVLFFLLLAGVKGTPEPRAA